MYVTLLPKRHKLREVKCILLVAVMFCGLQFYQPVIQNIFFYKYKLIGMIVERQERPLLGKKGSGGMKNAYSEI